MTDFTVLDHGSVVLLRANNEAAQAWTDANIGYEDWQVWGGNAIACEPRLVGAVVDGIAADGLTVEVA